MSLDPDTARSLDDDVEIVPEREEPEQDDFYDGEGSDTGAASDVMGMSGSDSEYPSRPSRQRRHDSSYDGEKGSPMDLERRGEAESKMVFPKNKRTHETTRHRGHSSVLVRGAAIDPFWEDLPPPSPEDEYCFFCEDLSRAPQGQGSVVRKRLEEAKDQYGISPRKHAVNGIYAVYITEYYNHRKHKQKMTIRGVIIHMEYHGKTAPDRHVGQELMDMKLLKSRLKANMMTYDRESGLPRVNEKAHKMYLATVSAELRLYAFLNRNQR